MAPAKRDHNHSAPNVDLTAADVDRELALVRRDIRSLQFRRSNGGFRHAEQVLYARLLEWEMELLAQRQTRQSPFLA